METNALQNLAQDPTSMLVIFSPVLLVIGFLFFLLIRQRRQINQLQEAAKPRYGFLGKPVYTFMALAIMAGAFGITVYQTQLSSNLEEVGATKEIKVSIVYKIEESTPSGYKVAINAIPFVGQQEWGSGQDKFDVYWRVEGPVNFTQLELDLNQNKTGGFDRVIPAGTYTVTVDVFSAGNSTQSVIRMQIP